MYLVFDTETTGLPKNWRAPTSDLDNWPRMIQVAWILFDEAGKEISKESHIIKPEGFIIPPEATKVHGISTEKAETEGEDLKTILNEFSNTMSKAEVLIAHNMGFDEKIIGAEFLRKEVSDSLSKIKKVCTKIMSTDFCQIPGVYGNKWPTLAELHTKLFNEDFKDAHDALVDTTTCAKCFFKLKELGVIK